jgi:hypothetical protein
MDPNSRHFSWLNKPNLELGLIFQTRDPGSLDWKQPIKKNQEAQFPTSQMLNDEIEKTNFIYIDPKQKKNNN